MLPQHHTSQMIFVSLEFEVLLQYCQPFKPGHLAIHRVFFLFSKCNFRSLHKWIHPHHNMFQICSNVQIMNLNAISWDISIIITERHNLRKIGIYFSQFSRVRSQNHRSGDSWVIILWYKVEGQENQLSQNMIKIN